MQNAVTKFHCKKKQRHGSKLQALLAGNESGPENSPSGPADKLLMSTECSSLEFPFHQTEA